MDKNKRKQRNRNIFKVAMILYTQGLEYDDRIRKEILSLQKGIPNLEFTIFAVVPENKEKSGTTDYGVPYYFPYLKTRDKYKSGEKTLLKAYDFYKSIKQRLNSFDVVWCADIETFMFPLLLPCSTKIIWDQHEIPAKFMSNGIMKAVFRYMERKCNIMYHANQPRIDYMKRSGAINKLNKHIPIRNYPENLESTIPIPDEKFLKFKSWLGDRKCAYIQGISNICRKGFETLSAVLSTPDLCAVVVGSVDNNELEKVFKVYGEKIIKDRLFFTWKIPQKMTKLYIKECVISLVFYSTDTPNNIYCEPNRMFQSIMMGIPVIVGNNPSMKDMIDTYNFGIALDNDGSDIRSIVSAINKVLLNHDLYKQNVLHNRNKLCWNNQESLLLETFKKAIKL